MGWAGTVVERSKTRLVLEDPRPLHAGLVKGSSDIIGLTRLLITQEMVGARLAVFTGIEAKMPRGRVTSEQEKFIRFVRQFGGIAGVARSPEDAVQIIKAGPDLFLKG